MTILVNNPSIFRKTTKYYGQNEILEMDSEILEMDSEI